jgi:hypothetical protein
MDTFDENYDGIIDYDEKAGGYETAEISIMSYASGINTNPAYGELKANFINSVYYAKYCDAAYNLPGYDFLKGKVLLTRLATAYQMSQSPDTAPDLFVEGMYYGRGNWPSFTTVIYLVATGAIFGTQSAENISLNSLYGIAFQYADKVQNYGRYTGSLDPNTSAPDSIQQYRKAIMQGEKPLDFTLYVPIGYGSLNEVEIPNVLETTNPDKIYTVHFKEIW